VKASIVRLALGFAALTSSVASAQYYTPPAARPTAVYRSPAAAQPIRVAQSTTRAAVPSATVMVPPAFRPINPPSQTTQRVLTAQRSPTPAPAQVRQASATTSAQPAAQPMGSAFQPPMNGQPWVPPTPSMPYDSGVTGYGMGPGGPAAAAPAGAAPAGGPVADPGMDYGYGGDGGCGGGCGHGCGRCCLLRSCCCGLGQHGCCIPFRTTGDLVQHMPFFGTTHGYYYFRPYHVMHVFSQQELVTRWGGDPRNPYDNTMFQRIYEQMGVEARPEPKKGTTTVVPVAPIPDQEYIVPTPSTTTTPMPTYSAPGPTYVPHPPTMAPGRTVTPLPGVEPVPTPIP
jgi:hypothetical protein